MASVSHAIERMRYWCDEADLGYDQGNRWDIRPGGECDCSSLVIHVLREAGFDTGAATYTGNMSRELTARGWVRLDPDGDPAPGDVLLSDGYHVALYLGAGLLGQASIDETGDIWGGASGDQTGYETNVRSYYDYPWDAYLRYTGTDTTSQGPTGGTTTLNPNGYGPDYVARVQQLLTARGYDIGPDGADGLHRRYLEADSEKIEHTCGQRQAHNVVYKGPKEVFCNHLYGAPTQLNGLGNRP